MDRYYIAVWTNAGSWAEILVHATFFGVVKKWNQYKKGNRVDPTNVFALVRVHDSTHYRVMSWSGEGECIHVNDRRERHYKNINA